MRCACVAAALLVAVHRDAAAKDAIFVATYADVTAYPVGSHGDVAPVAVTPDMVTSTGIARDASDRIYVANYATNTVTVYASSANGNQPALAVIGGSLTGLSGPLGVALDPSGEIFVLNATKPGVSIFPPLENASGLVNEAPIAILTGPKTRLKSPVAIAVDSTSNIYIANAKGGPDKLFEKKRPGSDAIKYAPGSVTVYPAGSNGDVAPASVISGIDTGLFAPLSIGVDSAGKIYIANNDYAFFHHRALGAPASIAVYSSGSHGDSQPIASISGDATLLQSPNAIAFDTSDNLYVTDYGGPRILSYSVGSSGNVSPTADLFGPNTQLVSSHGVTVDSAGKIHALNEENVAGLAPGAGVTVYAAGSSGDGAPVNTITSSFTGLPITSGITIDSSGKIYVTEYPSCNASAASDCVGGSVMVYAAGTYATGSPIASITGNHTGLLNPVGVVVDSEGNINALSPGQITVYPPQANGDVSPARVVSIDMNGKNLARGIAIGHHDELYVAGVDLIICKRRRCRRPYRLAGGNIAVYQPGSGGSAPSSRIRGPLTGLSLPSGVAVGNSGKIYVANQGGSVTVYAPRRTGNVPPIATISGPHTKLGSLQAIGLDSHENVYVISDDSIQIYKAGSDGDVSPLATIGGPHTGLFNPIGIAVGPAGP